jgi:hypothetical protein
MDMKKIIKSPLTWVVVTLLFGATGLGVLATVSIAMLVVTLIMKLAS